MLKALARILHQYALNGKFILPCQYETKFSSGNASLSRPLSQFALAPSAPRLPIGTIWGLMVILAGGSWLTACTPTVKVEIPDKPIEINLNVKIEHEIRVKVDKELDELFEQDSELF